jgi:hypothetical protein
MASIRYPEHPVTSSKRTAFPCAVLPRRRGAVSRLSISSFQAKRQARRVPRERWPDRASLRQPDGCLSEPKIAQAYRHCDILLPDFRKNSTRRPTGTVSARSAIPAGCAQTPRMRPRGSGLRRAHRGRSSSSRRRYPVGPRASVPLRAWLPTHALLRQGPLRGASFPRARNRRQKSRAGKHQQPCPVLRRGSIRGTVPSMPRHQHRGCRQNRKEESQRGVASSPLRRHLITYVRYRLPDICAPRSEVRHPLERQNCGPR